MLEIFEVYDYNALYDVTDIEYDIRILFSKN